MSKFKWRKWRIAWGLGPNWIGITDGVCEVETWKRVVGKIYWRVA